MEYILMILIEVLVLLIVQRRLPDTHKTHMKWVWLAFVVINAYMFLTAPYRIARVWGDIVQLSAIF